MIIDEKGKIFGKINIIDLIIIVFIILTLLGTYYKFNMAGTKKGIDYNTIEYEVEIKDIRTPSVEAISEGSEVFDDETGNKIGQVVTKIVKSSEGLILKQDGTYEQSKVPDRYDLKLVIESEGFEDDYGFFVGGKKEIKRGSGLKLRSRLITYDSLIIGVKKK